MTEAGEKTAIVEDLAFTRHGASGAPDAPLVILPGLMCDSRMFGFQLSAFGGICVDGFYGGADSIGAMADYALERMPERCSLLGHSMGARVAIELFRRAPERIARLALADTGVHGVRDGEAEKRFALRDLGLAEGADALVDTWLPPMIGPERADDAELYATLRAMSVDAGVATYDAQIRAMLGRPDAATVLPDIDCPTAVIVGRDDNWSPIKQHEEIAAAIPGARLMVIEHAGHMAPFEQPAAFNEALGTWLSWPVKGE